MSLKYKLIYSHTIGNTTIFVWKKRGIGDYAKIENLLLTYIQKFSIHEANRLNQFNKVNFIIEDKFSGGLESLCACVHPEEIKENEMSIHINIKKMIEEKYNSFYKISEILRHELNHCIFNYLNKDYSHIKSQSLKKLNREVSKYSKDIKLNQKLIRKGEQKKVWKNIREELFLLIRATQEEGIATFAGVEPRLQFNENVLKEWYSKATNESINFTMSLNHVINNFSKTYNIEDVKFKRLIDVGGFHIVYTILWVYKNRIDLRHLMKMKPFEFIKTYENACSHLGIKPVISINGQGVFDYNTYLRKWWNVLK